jgi:hypothetical protein
MAAPRLSRIPRTIPFLLVVAVLCVPVHAKVIYVDDNAPAGGDGISWATAYTYLQDALADANAAEKPVEIRVAQGVYKPDQGASQTPGSREASFQLISGVALTGGYAGPGVLDVNDDSIDPNMRQIDLFKTVLSGDLNGDDREDGGLDDSSTDPNRAENCYHVLIAGGTEPNAVLDGFVITAGMANGEQFDQQNGGGLYNEGGSPTFRNCLFSRNVAEDGGGVYNAHGCPGFVNCVFMRNEAVHIEAVSLLEANFGGGVYNGGLSNPVFVNCAFLENRAEYGGAINAWDQSSVELYNCTLSGNRADFGGAFYNCADGSEGNVSRVVNSILWGNSATTSRPEILNCAGNRSSTTTVTYSCIAGGYGGAGNILTSPGFVSGLLGDYYLSQASAGQSWSSPCVDAGSDTASNLGLDERTTRTDEVGDQGTVDMGYHYPQWVSLRLKHSEDVEGFESGNLNSLPWKVSGDTGWVVSSDEKNSGHYSARAGRISDGQRSVLSIEDNRTSGEVSFYYKISSEEHFDYLTFYVDGMVKGTWSGEQDWTKVSFPVAAGTRTFEWVYAKDDSDSRGSDTAWIDDIVFPTD